MGIHRPGRRSAPGGGAGRGPPGARSTVGGARRPRAAVTPHCLSRRGAVGRCRRGRPPREAMRLDLRLRDLSPLYVLFPAVLAAAGALGWYGFRLAGDLGHEAERSIQESIREVVDEKVQRIEQLVIERD